MRRMGLWVCVLVLLTACGNLLVGTNGPATVILGPAERIEAYCSALTGRRAVGCLVPERSATDPTKDTWTIWCPYNDVRCLAHELRHVIDPTWTHP